MNYTTTGEPVFVPYTENKLIMKDFKPDMHNWKQANIQSFWADIATKDHLVQIYDTEKYFMNILEGFAGCGFISNDSVVVIATDTHLQELHRRLQHQGFNMYEKIRTHQYIPIDVHVALSKFMVNNKPNKKKFNDFISSVLALAKRNDRKVRAFGEIVAVLWSEGLHDDTIQLENLWHRLHTPDKFSLYCAYPKSLFQNTYGSFNKICKCHSLVIDGKSRPATEIYYRKS